MIRLKIVPFGKNIPPSCKYCEFGSADDKGIFCEKKNKIVEDKKCMKYRYDPLKRIPEIPPELPQYNAEDFKI